MYQAFPHEATSRHGQSRGASFARSSAFNSIVADVRHALGVCFLFALALLGRLIVMSETEPGGIATA